MKALNWKVLKLRILIGAPELNYLNFKRKSCSKKLMNEGKRYFSAVYVEKSWGETSQRAPTTPKSEKEKSF